MSVRHEHSEGGLEGGDRSETRAPEAPKESAGLFSVKVNHANRELYVSTTRAVAGVSLASFCGLLIGVMALSRNATHTGPQAARASEGAPRTGIIPPAELLPVAVVKTAPVAVRPPAPKPAQLVVTTPGKPAPVVTSTPKHPATPPTAPASPKPETTAKTPEGRVIGMTYLVFGSFPRIGDAKTAADHLKAQGVTCTIERSLPGWTRKGWYSVVSVQGYESSKQTACRNLVKSLDDRQIEAHLYKWRAVKGS
jgi:cell division septation protein DedD